MNRLALSAPGALIFGLRASAAVMPFPQSFHMQQIKASGTLLYTRVGGRGQAVMTRHRCR